MTWPDILQFHFLNFQNEFRNIGGGASELEWLKNKTSKGRREWYSVRLSD